MRTEIILLVEESPEIREAVARPYLEAGAWVEAPGDCARAFRFLATFRPDWILVSEKNAAEMLLWLRAHENRIDVPVVLLPDVQISNTRERKGGQSKAA